MPMFTYVNMCGNVNARIEVIIAIHMGVDRKHIDVHNHKHGNGHGEENDNATDNYNVNTHNSSRSSDTQHMNRINMNNRRI